MFAVLQGLVATLGLVAGPGCAMENPAFDAGAVGFEEDGVVDDGVEPDASGSSDGAESSADAETSASSGADGVDASGDGDASEDGDPSAEDGTSDVGEGDDATAGSTGDGDADAACTNASRCRAIPQDWTGWIAMVDAEFLTASQACQAMGDAYPSFLSGYYSGVDPVDDGCGCNCDEMATPAEMCDITEATVRLYEGGSDCQDPNTSVFVGPMSTTGCVGPFLHSGVTEVVGGTEPVAAQTSWDCKPFVDGDYEFDTPAGLCTANLGVVSGGACLTDDDVAGECISPPPDDAAFGDGICVWRAGVHACPDAYPVNHAGFTEVDDTRECEGCGCAAPEDGACNLRVELYAGDACITTIGATDKDADVCEPINYGGGTPPAVPLENISYRVVVDGLKTPPVCNDQGVATPIPGGAVTPAGPITVCCDQ